MIDRLKQFFDTHERLFVLTGAGISTASGIPDYRDESGAWKHAKPMQFSEFVSSHAARQRYWSRSYYGWQRFGRARPNRAHLALARLEQLGRVERTVTQNVDGLHQRAGSRLLTELHGSLASVYCLDCGNAITRAGMQQALLQRNPQLAALSAEIAPDGDAHLQAFDDSCLDIPACADCGGVLKPAVVFFGETVPPARVQQSREALARSDAMLVLGSSLMVFSGFRFVRDAVRAGIPVIAVNRGKTRADELLADKFEMDCSTALETALRDIDPALADSA